MKKTIKILCFLLVVVSVQPPAKASEEELIDKIWRYQERIRQHDREDKNDQELRESRRALENIEYDLRKTSEKKLPFQDQ